MFYDDSKEKNDSLKLYFKRLGEIVNETLSQSKEFQEVLNQIKSFGFGVDLSMIIGLGLYVNSKQTVKDYESGPLLKEGIRFEITSEDNVFLQRNGLRFDIDNQM